MKRNILIFGESHVVAIKQAIKAGSKALAGYNVQAVRLTKIKNKTLIGDINIADLRLICRGFDENDLVVSQIGGNQHATLGLIQHPQPFNVFDKDGHLDQRAPKAEIIPRSTIKDVFKRSIQVNAQCIQEIAWAGRHTTMHLASPPPKTDTAIFLRNVERDYVARGILQNGVSPAKLRLCLWEIQHEVLAAMLFEAKTMLLFPPEGTTTPQGYLAPEYYAEDATHANAAYGEKLLQQIAQQIQEPVATP